MPKLLNLTIAAATCFMFIAETCAQEPKPGDTLFVTKRISVTTDSGLHGISIGKEVILIRDDMTHYVVKDGEIEARAPKDSFTRSADSAKELQNKERERAAAAYRAVQEAQRQASNAASKAKLESELNGDTVAPHEMQRLGAIQEAIINPDFNGIPLSEIISSAVVATVRSPIYELSGGDLALCEMADRVSSKYSGANNSSYEAYRERYDAFQDLAKDAHPAKILGYVRPGFMLKALNWKSTDSAPVFFPKNIGGMRFGAVRWSDFSRTGNDSSRKWWNDSTQDPLDEIPDTNINTMFKAYPLTAKTLLFDPFEASDAILSNTDNTMTAAWIVDASDPSASSKLTRNGGVLAVVETRDGLFLGYLSEKAESGLSQITWEQATSTKNAPFKLKAEPEKDLKAGSSVFSLFDADTKTQKRVPSNNPQEFVVFPETYSELLHKGTWALKTSLAVPNDSGFEPLRELETQATFQFEIQKKLDRIQIQFDALDNDKLRLLVVSEYNIREVERKANANGGESITAKPWRKKKEQLSSDVALSGDGSALFTDGEKVYRIAAGWMKKPELTIYSVEKNRLTR